MQRSLHLRYRWRDESRFFNRCTWSAHKILRCSELSWLSFATSHAPHQDPVDLSNEAQTHGESFDALEGVAHSLDVVRDLKGILALPLLGWERAGLEEHEILWGGDRSFDPTG